MCNPKPKLTREEYIAALPRRHSAAGALFFNDDDEILIVKPSYKPHWSIPGGIVEDHEVPKAAMIREIKEEIGLSITPKRLLLVDCLPHRPLEQKLASYQFIFDGGHLSHAQIAKIKLCPNEMTSYSFVDAGTAISLMGKSMARELDMAIQAYHSNTTYYLEHGQIV